MSMHKLAIASFIGSALFALGCAAEDGNTNSNASPLSAYCAKGVSCDAFVDETAGTCQAKLNALLTGADAEGKQEINGLINFCKDLSCADFLATKDCWEYLSQD